jgi:uncharacterized protein (TIGR03086 family)
MRTIKDLRPHDERAVRATVTLVARVTPADLDLPTPCAEWDLGALLAHMTTQHRGFAAAAAGHGADPGVWRPTGNPLIEYAEAADQVIAAFAAPGVPERDFALPEITEERPIPGWTAIGFHFIDYVVHGWDVARTLGLPWVLPEDLLAAALPVARAVPGGDLRLAPGAAFAPGLPVAAGAEPLTEILELLGRSPTWAPPKIIDEGRPRPI